MAIQKFVTATHSGVKDAAGQTAKAQVPVEAVAAYEARGWKVDKGDLKAVETEAKEADKQAAADAKAAAKS